MELREYLRLFENARQKVRGDVLSDPRHLAVAYLLPGILELGPLEAPLPRFIRFEGKSMYGAEERGGKRRPVQGELQAVGLQLFRLFDPGCTRN